VRRVDAEEATSGLHSIYTSHTTAAHASTLQQAT
jgi:hypothetical protein